MSPAPRKPQNKGLPENLHTHPRGGFRYWHPIKKAYIYLSHDRQKAVDAAKAANLHFDLKGRLFDKITDNPAKPIAKFISEYVTKKLPTYGTTEETRKNREYILLRIQKSVLGEKHVEDISTRELYEYLESLPSDWTRQSYRAQLHQLFVWAKQTGLRTDNPATDLGSLKPKRSRERLSLDQFNTIYSHAPHWLQNAMDLGLQTIQRPGDVLAMQFEHLSTTHLRFIQQKTGKKLQLEIGAPLREVLERCRDRIVSPYIVHRLPQRLRPRELRAKHRTHHTQVLLEQAERAFAVARDDCGLYKGNKNPPTLHEIRSLGASLYRKAGWQEWKVQMLLGHSEIQMTRHYLKGHEAPWDTVPAGLDLAGIS